MSSSTPAPITHIEVTLQFEFSMPQLERGCSDHTCTYTLPSPVLPLEISIMRALSNLPLPLTYSNVFSCTNMPVE